jgi:putative ABC transport system substrate-binding protein
LPELIIDDDSSERPSVTRRVLLRGLGIAAATAAVVGVGEVWSALRAPPDQTRVLRVAFLFTDLFNPITQYGTGVIRDTLRDLGFGPGRIAYELLDADRDTTRFPAVAERVVALNPNVIVCQGHHAALALKAATRTIPVVFLTPGVNPVVVGIVPSFSRPGGNLTGITTDDDQIHAKQLQLLKECVPAISRVAIVRDKFEAPQAIVETQFAAEALGMQILAIDLGAVGELDAGLLAAAAWHADALVQTQAAHSMIDVSGSSRIADFALKRRWPSFTTGNVAGLLSYASSAYEVDTWQRVAKYVDRILRGADPAALPVEIRSGSRFIVNMCTAAQLELSVPQSVLEQAVYVSRPPGEQFAQLCRPRR